VSARELPAFVRADPHALVEECCQARTLAEVCDAVESYDAVLDVHRRLGMHYLPRTRALLFGLGLTTTRTGGLVDDDVLAERLAALREVA